MAEPTEHPDVSRMMVAFLRFYADITQRDLARAARLVQSQVSEIETGDIELSEDMLRRIGSATGVRWELMTHLRRFLNAFLFAAEGGGAVSLASADLLESPAVLAYLLEDEAAARRETPPRHG